MFFNSYPFLFLFLPLVTLVFHLLSRVSSRCSTGWIILASLFFYGCFQPWMVGVLLGEALVNHALARCAASHTASRGRRVSCTALAVTFDLLVLGYFKYADFFLANMGSLLGEQWSLHRLIFPVGISFYTFQLVAYVVDAYRGKVERFDLLDYLAFVTFFPKLLSGPIVLDRELTGQFSRASGVDWDLFNRGVVLFVVGLFKKVVIADAFAPMVHNGFDTGEPLAFVAAWVASLGYTVQLYFDFSGYMDMALGCALLLGIKLPPNFDSPYKSLSIQDFWRRWHITLGRFLRDYIYIPLGGNRGGTLATCRNLFVTFLLGGIWHGAGWTFVVWGGCMAPGRSFTGFGRLREPGFHVFSLGWSLFCSSICAGYSSARPASRPGSISWAG